MTKKQLSSIRYLNREIRRERERKRALEQAAVNVAAKVSGLPHMGSVSDKTAIAGQIADCQRTIDRRICASVEEYNRLLGYIYGVEDCLVRTALIARYIDGKSWCAAARAVGGYNTADGVRKACERYLGR